VAVRLARLRMRVVVMASAKIKAGRMAARWVAAPRPTHHREP
jgi:hypothetical protein